MKKRKGFTLLELMVVLSIVTIIGAALFMSMSSGRRVWYAANTRIALQEDLRRGIRQIIDDVSQSSTSKINISANNVNYSSLSFNISLGVDNSTGNVNWSASPINYTLVSGQLLRRQGANSTVLANNISSVVFSRYSNSTKILRLNLTAQRTTPYNETLSSSIPAAVYMRN